MAAPQSDALVLFGITGDLAKKKLLPAVYHLAARDRLPAIVLGVASRELAEGALEQRFREAVTAVEPNPDEDVIENVLKRLKYVSGDYREQSTFGKLKEALEASQHPLYFLAIPPSLFDDVVQGLATQGINKDGRVVVEKPFGRDLESAEELNDDPARRVRREPRSTASITSSGRSRSRTCSCSASRTRCSSRSGTTTTSTRCRSRWPRRSGSRAAASSTKRWVRCVTSCRTTFCR